uniref:UBC core domain-containing protein n=1 Tax=Amorphochlora amoebiformis TaxID=1561963 RepID=A0A7S0DQ80_9EUKA
MPKKRGAHASYCDLQMESVAERLGLLRGRKQKHNFNMGIWVPASPPSFGRQTSFDMVVLARQKSLNERAGAEVAIAAFKAPMRTHHKVGLFLSTDREELYLQISFPKAILNMPAAVMSLITEYSGFKIKKLNIQKHAKRLYETAFKHAQANPTSKSPREVVASRILDEGVRSMLRKVFGNTKTPKPKDKKPDPKSDSKGQTESKSNASPPANSKTNPSNDLKPSKNSNEDPNSPMDDIDNVFLGASYLELQVLLAAVELLYTEITGRPYVSSDIKYLNRSDARRLSLQMSKGLEVKVAPAPIARPTRRGTAGYKGSAGEQAKVGSAIEKKKKELDKADQLATFLLCALSESISSLQTKGRLVRSHEDLIKGSVVNPIVGSLLKNNSLMQIAERPVMFMQVLRVVESICCGPSKTLPKALLGGKQKHVVDMPPLLRTLERQANVLARSTSTPTKLKPADKKGKKKRIDKDFKAAAEQNEFASEMLRILTATNLVMKTILKERAKEEQKLMIDKGDKKNSKDSGTAKIENLRRWMSDNSVRMVDVVNDTKYKHKYKASTQPPGTGRLMNRLTREVGAMMSGLPPGLALRVDEKRMDIMRAMIIGPTGGPYENGVFFFDIHTHGSYPNGPPKCSIITTGKGTFRFNANLYTRGKVCLSLLGTWSGPGWDSRYSTLVQVLLSIQAMILGVEEPIANEPGWESGVGTTRSKRYNGILKHGTMKHAMLEYLVNEPPKGFEEIVKAHFYTNKEHLLKKQLPSWLEEAKAAGNSSSGPYGHENKIDSTPDKDYNNLVQALEKLKAPEIDEEEEEGSDESDDDDF